MKSRERRCGLYVLQLPCQSEPKGRRHYRRNLGDEIPCPYVVELGRYPHQRVRNCGRVGACGASEEVPFRPWHASKSLSAPNHRRSVRQEPCDCQWSDPTRIGEFAEEICSLGRPNHQASQTREVL